MCFAKFHCAACMTSHWHCGTARLKAVQDFRPEHIGGDILDHINPRVAADLHRLRDMKLDACNTKLNNAQSYSAYCMLIFGAIKSLSLSHCAGPSGVCRRDQVKAQTIIIYML